MAKILPANTGDIVTWFQLLGPKDPLEEGIATHSSILPGESPWTEESNRPQPMGSQRVGHD